MVRFREAEKSDDARGDNDGDDMQMTAKKTSVAIVAILSGTGERVRCRVCQVVAWDLPGVWLKHGTCYTVARILCWRVSGQD